MNKKYFKKTKKICPNCNVLMRKKQQFDIEEKRFYCPKCKNETD